MAAQGAPLFWADLGIPKAVLLGRWFWGALGVGCWARWEDAGGDAGDAGGVAGGCRGHAKDAGGMQEDAGGMWG